MNKTMISRRRWLKSGVLLGAGIAIAPASFGSSRKTSEYNPFTGEFHRLSTSKAKLLAKLNANENPYGPSEKALKAFTQSAVSGNRYPFDLANDFKKVIAHHEKVSPDHVFIGAGSSEVLTMTALAFGASQGAIMSAFPTFQTLMDTAVGIKCDWQQVQLDNEYKHDLNRMEESISAKTRLIYICNPNNPTGTKLAAAKLKAFCNRVTHNVPVFVDEAYTDFNENPEDMSMIDLVREEKPAIIARTFSKIHGLAGLRIGYGIAPPALVKKITTYSTQLVTISGPSIHAAMASYEDEDFKAYCRDKNEIARKYTFDTLTEMGFKPIPSSTSFMIFPIKKEPEPFLEEMTQLGVGVRSWVFDNKNWCRVSIGTKEEMETFTSTLKQVLNV